MIGGDAAIDLLGVVALALDDVGARLEIEALMQAET
jgi:hypothetical protein